MIKFNKVNIPDDIQNKLRKLIGIDLVEAMNIFREYKVPIKVRGYSKTFGGFPEELIAFLLEKDRPANKKGADFEGLFEVKSIKSRKLVNGDIRTCGDTPISNFNENDIDFLKSNIWNKIEKLLSVFHFNGTIIDIRFFDGNEFKSILKNDYELIKNKRNKETKILTLKSIGNIQIKKNGAIHLSTSICENVDNEIKNQKGYIMNLFGDALNSFVTKDTLPVKSIKKIVDNPNITINDLKKIIELAEMKIKESEIDCYLPEDNLPF